MFGNWDYPRDVGNSTQKPTDLSPMLHQEVDNSPQLGGDKATRPCPKCDEGMMRDFFGTWFCPKDIVNRQKLEALMQNPFCPRCGEDEYLSLEPMTLHPYTADDGIVWVFCEWCDCCVWISDGYFCMPEGVEFGWLVKGGITEVDPFTSH